MGNKICCEEESRREFGQVITGINRQEAVRVPNLNPIVLAHLSKHKPFASELSNKPVIKLYGNDVYEGEIDERGRPHGFGKMYHNDGSIFIGEFFSGVADGKGHFVKPDGSYYEGKMKDNMANDENAFYWEPKFDYQGSVIKNLIDGYGKETGENHYFEGTYKNGQKFSGILTWREGENEFRYEGPFNSEGNFEGNGKLWQKNQGEYFGSFDNGLKHGKGSFVFLTGSKYIGEYYYGYKEGEGQLIDHDGSIIYKGEFKRGMPHGIGLAKNEKGELKERSWISGIDKMLLED